MYLTGTEQILLTMIFWDLRFVFLLLGSFLQTAIRHKKRYHFALFCDIHSCMSKINWKFYKNMLMFIILSIILIQVCINYRNNKIKIRYLYSGDVVFLCIWLGRNKYYWRWFSGICVLFNVWGNYKTYFVSNFNFVVSVVNTYLY
jgi:hypothetical protein